MERILTDEQAVIYLIVAIAVWFMMASFARSRVKSEKVKAKHRIKVRTWVTLMLLSGNVLQMYIGFDKFLGELPGIKSHVFKYYRVGVWETTKDKIREII